MGADDKQQMAVGLC